MSKKMSEVISKRKHLEVPLVQEDLSQKETIVQIANTLLILQQAASSIFSHVHDSINQTKQSLNKIQQRNIVVQDKIKQLETMQKSVIVLSSSKYPYNNDTNHEITFNPPPRSKLKFIQQCVDQPDQNANVDKENKIKFYHVKTSEMLRKNVELSCDETLGRVPHTLDSITSCMLFNTCDNVYEKYVIQDPLSSSRSKRNKEEMNNVKKIKMEDAPKSLSQQDSPLTTNQSFVYSPTVEEPPIIDLPLDLPDLVGFADDFRYTGEDDMKKKRRESLTPKPKKSSSQKEPKLKQPTPSIVENIVTSVTNTPIVTTSPSAAPVQQVQNNVSAPAPPPPPMPPPSPPPVEKSSEPIAQPTPSSSSLHANLMEAIRNAGGTGKAKLKNVVNSGIPEKISSSPSTGGDLMSDLHAKLSLRRKGISGQAKEASSLMDKLLSTIPPPPAPGGGSSSSSENEAENNDAEWDD